MAALLLEAGGAASASPPQPRPALGWVPTVDDVEVLRESEPGLALLSLDQVHC